MVGDWPFCDGEHQSVLRVNAARLEVFVDVGPDGRVRFPSGESAHLPSGFERRKLTSAVEVRSFLSRIDSAERAKFHARVEAEEAIEGEIEAELRRDAIAEGKGFSEKGQEFLRLALNSTNTSACSRYDYEPGNHFVPIEYNRGNWD